MPTEQTLSYQDQIGEEQARCILWITNQFSDNPVRATVVSLVLLILVITIVIPLVLAFLRNLGVTELFGVAFSEKKPNARKRIEDRISTCPTPRLTGDQHKVRMPKRVVELAEKMENARFGERFRYCVVCSDKELLQCYAVQFYERMKQSSVINHYGWIYYDIPKDETIQWDIQDCLLEGLRICPHEKTSEDRFRAFVYFFDDPKLHTLLVIRMCEHVQDRKLAQLANLEGLSLVLFSDTSIDGYDIINIPVKGGRGT